MRKNRKNVRYRPDPHGYPRPQLVRENWTNLNGPWNFVIDPEATLDLPDRIKWMHRSIQVPYAPECTLSGIKDTGLYKACWYRTTFNAPKLAKNERLILHFGAVDYHARVWVNNQFAIEHEGGYTSFEVDITDLLAPAPNQSVVVRAYDDPADLCKPRGKQDWLLDPHSIWYPRTTGIWQTVWMEVVSKTRIESIQWSSNAADWSISMCARVIGCTNGNRLAVCLRLRDRVLVDDACRIVDGQVLRVFSLPDPGIDDARNALLWSPSAPNLIDVDLELLDADDNTVDRATSYAAMRSVGVQGDRFVMNGRPMPLRLVLDQGYWRDSGLTAPSDDAIRRDVELVKEMGFNGVRKHQKIDDPRFLYWADRLGLLVWEEMPSAYAFDEQTVRRVSAQWAEAIARDSSHPCIVAWVPLNESWGVPDLPHSAAQRDFARSLYHLTKSLDPTRPVIGNDGWEHLATDILTIHDYDGDAQRIARRYENSAKNIKHLFEHERPGNKALLLEGIECKGRPIMLSEFGGIAYSKDPAHTWGYRRARTAVQYRQQLGDLMKAVHSLPLFAGFCYTQFTDTYQEANGLLDMDRRPKIPIKDIRAMIAGR